MFRLLMRPQNEGTRNDILQGLRKTGGWGGRPEVGRDRRLEYNPYGWRFLAVTSPDLAYQTVTLHLRHKRLLPAKGIGKKGVAEQKRRHYKRNAYRISPSGHTVAVTIFTILEGTLTAFPQVVTVAVPIFAILAERLPHLPKWSL